MTYDGGKKASGPQLEGRALTDQEREQYEWRGRVDQRLETITLQNSEIFNLLRRLDCGKHDARLEALERQMSAVSTGISLHRKTPSGEVRPGTGSSHRAVSQRDLEESQRLVVAELESRVDRSVEERLAAVEEQQERRSENSRRKVKDWLEILRTAIMIAAAAGVGGTVALRCGSPAQSAQMKRAELRRVLMPSAAADANVRGR